MPVLYLLDTNILSQLIRDPRGPVTRRIEALGGDTVCTSVIVACELRYGAARKASPMLTQKVDALLASIPVQPFDGEADRHQADIRSGLEGSVQVIGSNDLLIAAHARSLGACLVSNNRREFERVPGLAVDDWLA